jgi:hypothetical protein
MSGPRVNSPPPSALSDALGYLNFSSGTSDPRFLRNLNAIFTMVAAEPGPGNLPMPPLYERVGTLLRETLAELATKNPAFQDIVQAAAVLELVWNGVLPAYLQHHRDLLFHQTAPELFQPFFVGRVCEAVLAEGAPWDEPERIVPNVLGKLNDYLGYRPLPVLHNRRKNEPYPHERCRPVPLYIAGAGVALGRYQTLVTRALELLRSLDANLLQSAWFDPDLLDELAFDPRAYDFNHPANKRPNYHFGMWDPHVIDGRGFYRRFVVQQTLLESLLERIDALQTNIAREELLEEAAVVLVGTMLMASGTTGNGPECHDSTVTLSTLLPIIAGYRDEYYRSVLDRMEGKHAERLKNEIKTLRQPFAGARQNLNAQLARRRALQMQHVHLAILFARLGYPQSALQQADIIPAVSARMTCQLYCLLTSGWHAASAGQVAKAAEYLPQIETLLKRAINCGAVVDPWGILGFGGQFSLFPAVENAVPDLRVDELLDLMEQVFALAARSWHLAAVGEDEALRARISASFRRLSEWWDQFATTTVEGIKAISGRASYVAAEHVAEALRAWHLAGSAAGDIAFWRGHADQFDSPQAYARVIEALLEKRDLASAAGLLMHWLSQAEQLPLEEGMFSFHILTQQWLALAIDVSSGAIEVPAPKADTPTRPQFTIGKFFGQLEANADTFGEPPELLLGGKRVTREDEDDDLFRPTDDEDEEEGSSELYGAAYDEMIYRDSTRDGNDSSLQDSGASPTDYEMEAESRRITARLAFLTTQARLWKRALLRHPLEKPEWQLSADTLGDWLAQARNTRRKLSQLAHAIERQPLAPTSAEHEALVEYDRRRMVKESLLERVIATSVVTAEAELFLRAVLTDESSGVSGADDTDTENAEPEHWAPTVELWRALLKTDTVEARKLWPSFLAAIRKQPLLYVPLAKGGDPRRIAVARSMQQTMRMLLAQLPRLGLLREACQLIQTARAMERDHPLGAGAVTEFDRLFEIGFKAIVTCLLDSAESWDLPRDSDELADFQLMECLQQITESLLSEWLSHSRTLRLSVLEKINTDAEWREFVAFVEKYGHDLFTQKFFNLGNLRAILHQGVEAWLKQLAEHGELDDEVGLLADLEKELPRSDGRRHLQLVIEAIVENYTEYRDYNATTTQSDRGEMVYMLLDFLRIKAGYERIHWNLRPVMMAHEVLVRANHAGAAELWRRTMAERTADAADQHLKRLNQLQKKYGMRLPTIADRLAERFVRPLDIDRIRALVKPAAEDAKQERASEVFDILESEASDLAGQPAGAGLDLPDWLVALEEEVDTVCGPTRPQESSPETPPLGPAVKLTWDEIQSQLTNWEVKYLEEK